MKGRYGESKSRIYVVYTLGFLCLTGIIVFFNTMHGQSFVHGVDILDQEYPIFLYLGEQLRQLLSLRKFHFYDFSFGFGGDMIATANHNGLGDPINLLSVFAVDWAAGYVYAFTLFLRVYLSGISMLLFCRKHAKEGQLCVLAGLSYGFSLFVITYGLQFYQTLNAAYLFPLILIQFEKLVYEERNVNAGIKFALLIAVQACCNFYFLYMQTIILFVYGSVVFYTDCLGNLRFFIKKVFGVAAYYLLGIMLSAVVLFPAVAGFLRSARMESGIGKKLRLFWDMHEIKIMIADLFVPMLTSWSTGSLGISFVALLAVVGCCISKERKEKIFALILIVAYLCPFIWSIFNGFSYPVHRWIYVLHFAIIYVTILFIERTFDMGGGKANAVGSL